MESKFLHQQKFIHKMSLTPQMRHSIKILGMSTKDLNEYVDSVIEINPFLQKILSKNDFQYRNYNYSLNNSGFLNENSDNSPPQKDNPYQDLLISLKMLDLTSEALEIGEYLIYEMDENGYINTPLEDVSREFSISIEEVEECLSAIQSLNPPGIGARNVQECLKLQLERKKKEGSLEYEILSHCITDLATNDTKKISKTLQIKDTEKIKEAIRNIKKLNPRPGNAIFGKNAQHITPDLIVTIKDKKIRLELNREWLPRLRLYNPYENKLDIIKDPEVKKFFRENMSSAKYYIDGLKRREETMCKVADYILNFHRDFLCGNTSEMKSLTIKEISKALSLHPSTINRAVSNKYIQFGNETTLLKRLLSQGIKKLNGEITSKITIENKIKEILKNEDKNTTLSDEAIKKQLETQGIEIKRRTIAKYRKSLKILPAYLRKKHNII